MIPTDPTQDPYKDLLMQGRVTVHQLLFGSSCYYIIYSIWQHDGIHEVTMPLAWIEPVTSWLPTLASQKYIY